jgi:DNA polymerase I-like protein with 3'-5' exonuclease and polymerase domains
MPLVPVLAAMEAGGVPFAPGLLRRQVRQTNRRLRELEEHAAGRAYRIMPP